MGETELKVECLKLAAGDQREDTIELATKYWAFSRSYIPQAHELSLKPSEDSDSV
jgi:hypothetical protein